MNAPAMNYSESHLHELSALVDERLAHIRDRIASVGGDPLGVKIVGVTKTFGLDAVIAACRVGLSDLGENYADELVTKANALAQCAPEFVPRWHFLGGLQRNKINRLRSRVGLFEGIDRYEEGVALAKRAPGASVLVEVNVAQTPGRGGVALGEVPTLVGQLRELDLVVEGLMTVAAPGDKRAATRAFHEVATLKAELGLHEASMGMSEDLELAVTEGATMIRVGRALFGPRT
jgi:hypothetical protein